jgi:hypothetical protein
MARTRSTKAIRARARGRRRQRFARGSAAIETKLDNAVREIKKTSRSDAEAASRIKALQVKFGVMYGARPMSRLVAPVSIEGVKVTRIEVLLPPGFDASDLPPHGGDPADGDSGDPISKGPPYDTDRSDAEDLDGL